MHEREHEKLENKNQQQRATNRRAACWQHRRRRDRETARRAQSVADRPLLTHRVRARVRVCPSACIIGIIFPARTPLPSPRRPLKPDSLARKIERFSQMPVRSPASADSRHIDGATSMRPVLRCKSVASACCCRCVQASSRRLQSFPHFSAMRLLFYGCERLRSAVAAIDTVCQNGESPLAVDSLCDEPQPLRARALTRELVSGDGQLHAVAHVAARVHSTPLAARRSTLAVAVARANNRRGTASCCCRRRDARCSGSYGSSSGSSSKRAHVSQLPT